MNRKYDTLRAIRPVLCVHRQRHILERGGENSKFQGKKNHSNLEKQTIRSFSASAT